MFPNGPLRVDYRSLHIVLGVTLALLVLARFGWRLTRHAWHHGYASEAARAALTVAFDGAGLPEVWSFTSVLNEPSTAVMRRIGMSEVGRFDHPRIPAGHPLRPHVLYRLSRPESGS